MKVKEKLTSEELRQWASKLENVKSSVSNPMHKRSIDTALVGIQSLQAFIERTDLLCSEEDKGIHFER